MFIHDALNEWIVCGDTEISAANLRITIGRLGREVSSEGLTGFKNQFEVQFTGPPMVQEKVAIEVEIAEMGHGRVA